LLELDALFSVKTQRNLCMFLSPAGWITV